MIRSDWMSDAGYESGVRAERVNGVRQGRDATLPEPADLREQMSMASLGATLVAVVACIIMGMGKLSQYSPWSTTLAAPPEFLMFAWGMPGLLYSGLVTIVALGACTLAVLLAGALAVFVFHKLVCVGSLASASMSDWREARRNKRIGQVARLP